MGAFLVARLTDKTQDEMTYWIHNGSDETIGENVVVSRVEPHAARRIDSAQLRRGSQVMVGKVLRLYEQTNEWPKVVSLQS